MSHEIELAISCQDCVRRGTDDCRDCLVSFVLGSEPEELALDAEASRVAEIFVAEGMVPHLRFVALSARRPGDTSAHTSEPPSSEGCPP